MGPSESSPQALASSELPTGPTILVVEDDEVFRGFVLETLRQKGYRTRAAGDGLAALELLETTTFELIICDLSMPKLGGFQFIEAARRAGVNTPVLVTTGSQEPEDELRGLKMGAVDFIRKPVRRAVFLMRIQRALQSSSASGSGKHGVRRELTPGRRMGDFEIVRKLASGGMGSVYVALQLGLQREVALKVLKPDPHGDPRDIQRFQSEARAVAALDHPHVVKVLSIGTDAETDMLYFAMELIDGCTLKDRLAEGAMSYREILKVSLSVAKALQAAASKDLVHRDVKPGNIMIDSNGLVKILDFGLVKSQRVEQHLTRTGTVIGTPDYFSPEQAAARPLDARSDLYSLGIVLYEMLGGGRPFAADSTAGMVFLHTFGLPRPLARFRKLPKGFQQILDKLLAKDPDLRFADARELVLALQALEQKLARSGKLDARPSGPPVEPLSYDEAESSILSGEFLAARGSAVIKPTGRARVLWMWWLLAALVLAGCAWFLWWRLA